MYRLKGGCHCSNIRFEMVLPNTPETYSPRECYCDFCHKHGASYVTDPDGSLVIHLQNETLANRYHQGAGVADCLVCSNCGVMVAALYQNGEQCFATINSRTVEGAVVFAEKTPVSPKMLSAEEKTERWKKLWFQNVEVVIHQ